MMMRMINKARGRLPSTNNLSHSYSHSTSKKKTVTIPFKLADIGEGIHKVHILKWYPLNILTQPL
jgi:hypothetical protein